MSCNEILELLPLYVDDVLTPDEISQVDKHLLACDGCRVMLELLKGDQAALRNQPEVQVPPSFRRELMARIEAEERPVKHVNKNAWRYFMPRFSSLAAALLLIVLTTNLYFVPEYIEQQKLAQDLPPKMGIMAEGPDAQPESSGFGVRSTEDVQLTRVKEAQQRDPLIVQAWIWTTGLSIVVFSGAAGFWIYRYRKQN